MALKAGQVVGDSWEVHSQEVKAEQEKYILLLVLTHYYAHWSMQGTYGKDTLRPVTIKQVVDAQQPHPDAEFKIDEVEIIQVSPLDRSHGCLQSTCADTCPTDLLRRPNTQHIYPNNQHNLQTRRRHRHRRSKTMDRCRCRKLHGCLRRHRFKAETR